MLLPKQRPSKLQQMRLSPHRLLIRTLPSKTMQAQKPKLKPRFQPAHLRQPRHKPTRLLNSGQKNRSPLIWPLSKLPKMHAKNSALPMQPLLPKLQLLLIPVRPRQRLS